MKSSVWCALPLEAGSFSGGTNSPASPRVTDQAGCYADSAAVGQCDEVVSGDDLFHVLNAADVAGAGPYGDRGASVLGCGQGAAPGNSTQYYVPVMAKIPGSELALARSGGAV